MLLLCVHLFFLQSHSQMRIVAIKNGIILSASNQSGIQILQVTITKISASKYQPRDLKFHFIMRIKPPSMRYWYNEALHCKPQKYHINLRGCIAYTSTNYCPHAGALFLCLSTQLLFYYLRRWLLVRTGFADTVGGMLTPRRAFQPLGTRRLVCCF